MVHCHDGGGRSGTFLAIEANLSMVESRGLVDILGTVKWLHQQRSQLVSHPRFYRLIYDTLEDYIKCGDTSTKMEDMLMDDDITTQETPQDTPQNTPQDTPQDSLQVKKVVRTLNSQVCY